MEIDPDDHPTPPYYQLLGIEIVEAEPGYAVGRLPLKEELTISGPEPIVHGGAVASLADSAGYWAVTAANDLATTPTIDLRIDYLAPATDDLRAEARVTRNGSSVGVVDVAIETATERVAAARGVFKTGGGDGESSWDD